MSPALGWLYESPQPAQSTVRWCPSYSPGPSVVGPPSLGFSLKLGSAPVSQPESWVRRGAALRFASRLEAQHGASACCKKHVIRILLIRPGSLLIG